MKSVQPIQLARCWQNHIQMCVYGLFPEKRLPSFTRKKKFSFGVALALWPVLMLALMSSDSLIGHDWIWCTSALLSEAAAVVLFFQLRRRAKDRLTFWSTIAVAVAGEVTLALLIAAVAIAAHAS